MATIKDLLSSMIGKINSKVSTWEELPDKPFGTKTGMVEIVPLQSVTKQYAYGPLYYDTTSVQGLTLVVGKKYKVVLNGVEYITECKDGGANPYFGNHAVLKGDGVNTGEPFIVTGGEMNALSWYANLGETITLAIYGEGTVTVPISYEFMPEGYPKVKTGMVEVFAEQNLTGNSRGEGIVGSSSEWDGRFNVYLKQDTKYIVKVNGKDYIFDSTESDEDAGDIFVGLGAPWIDGEERYDFTQYPFRIDTGYESNESWTDIMWAPELPAENPTGNPITLQIFEEQKIITPINSKFAGLVITDNDGEITANMTFEQFKEWFDPAGYPNIVLITNDGSRKNVWQLVGYYDYSKTENPHYSFSFFTYHGTEEYTYYIWDENGLSQGLS